MKELTKFSISDLISFKNIAEDKKKIIHDNAVRCINGIRYNGLSRQQLIDLEFKYALFINKLAMEIDKRFFDLFDDN